MGDLLHHIIDSINPACLCATSETILCELGKCLSSGKKHKLPSISMKFIWSSFHKLRVSSASITKTWKSFLCAAEVPTMLCIEQQLTMQLLLDRSIKKLIAVEAESLRSMEPKLSRPLTLFECNGIR